MNVRPVLTAAALALCGCPSTNPSPTDAGTDPDTGKAMDAVSPDLGVVDAEFDGGAEDAEIEDVPVVDAGPFVLPTVEVSGFVVKAQAVLTNEPNRNVAQASVVALETEPPLATLSGANGTYSFTAPAGTSLLLAANAVTYRRTYSRLDLSTRNVQNYTVRLSEALWPTQIASSLGVTLDVEHTCDAPSLQGQTCRTAMLVGEVLDDGEEGVGQVRPAADVPRAAFALDAADGSTGWRVEGPVFLDEGGVATAGDATIRVEQGGRFLGGLFAYFVEVPATEALARFTLRVQDSDRHFGPLTVAVVQQAIRTEVTWISARDQGPFDVAVPAATDFRADVWPLFRARQSAGFGCVACHASPSPAGGLDLLSHESASTGLDASVFPARVNLGTPSNSTLLTYATYASATPHPTFAYLEGEAAFDTIARWIAEGASLTPTAPEVPFASIAALLRNDRSSLGMGCRSCHFDGVSEATAPGGLFLGDDDDALYRALTTDTPTDNGGTGEPRRIDTETRNPERSLLLTNLIVGSDEPHPVKIFTGTLDPRYKQIEQWIVQGFTND